MSFSFIKDAINATAAGTKRLVDKFSNASDSVKGFLEGLSFAFVIDLLPVSKIIDDFLDLLDHVLTPTEPDEVLGYLKMAAALFITVNCLNHKRFRAFVGGSIAHYHAKHLALMKGFSAILEDYHQLISEAEEIFQFIEMFTDDFLDLLDVVYLSDEPKLELPEMLPVLAKTSASAFNSSVRHFQPG